LNLDPISEKGMGFSFACQKNMVRRGLTEATVKEEYGIN
jgi:hypothetical protein